MCTLSTGGVEEHTILYMLVNESAGVVKVACKVDIWRIIHLHLDTTDGRGKPVRDFGCIHDCLDAVGCQSSCILGNIHRANEYVRDDLCGVLAA